MEKINIIQSIIDMLSTQFEILDLLKQQHAEDSETIDRLKRDTNQMLEKLLILKEELEQEKEAFKQIDQFTKFLS